MADARNIRLNGRSSDAVTIVQNRFQLEHMSDAARLGIAYALVRDLPVTAESTSGPARHNFNVATIDNEGVLVDLLRIMRPEDSQIREEPYKAIEALMNEGIRALDSAITAGKLNDLADLIAVGSTE